MKQTDPTEILTDIFAKIPGTGRRSARRAVYHLLQNKDSVLQPLLSRLTEAAEKVCLCKNCANLAFSELCAICADPKRDPSFICLTEKPQDVSAFERGGFFNGLYHVLGGTLSAFNGVYPENLSFDLLKKRLTESHIREITLALPPTREGKVTSFYLYDFIREHAPHCVVTAPACGLPVGGNFDFIDNGTLAASFADRKTVQAV